MDSLKLYKIFYYIETLYKTYIKYDKKTKQITIKLTWVGMAYKEDRAEN